MAKRARIAEPCGRRWPHEDAEGRRQVLEALLRERRHAVDAPPAAHADEADPGDAAREREEEMVWLAVLDRSREIQAQVDEALCRLAAGHYGRCADCGEPIPRTRLRALPFAVRCLRCQERLEGRCAVSAAAGSLP